MLRALARLAVTILVPLLLLVAADQLTLPGISAPWLESSSGALAPVRDAMSVFALGITPIFLGYVLVELVAFIVPRWSRLRHDNPSGRAKLVRIAHVVAIALATFQAVMLALTLKGIGMAEPGSAPFLLEPAPFAISVPLVSVTLMGGVCIQILAAQLISRWGLVNGFVAISGAGLVRGFSYGLRPMSGPVRSGFEQAAFGAAVCLLALVAWAALKNGAEVRFEAKDSSDPHRGARSLSVGPWIPIPSSSLSAYFVASALLMLPTTLSTFLSAFKPLADAVYGGDTLTRFLPIQLALLVVVAWGMARLLHRPRELAGLGNRLGAEMKGAAPRLRETFLPTILFLWVVAIASLSLGPSITGPAVVGLTAIGIDLATSFVREAKRGPLVVICEERRATAVPILRSILSAQGIESAVRGMSVLSLWQLFVPFAPAEILVARPDEERAKKALVDLYAKDRVPETKESEPTVRPARLGLLSAALGAVAVILLGLGVAQELRRNIPTEQVVGPPVELELVRVDDSFDPFAEIRDVPPGEGIELFRVAVPVGLDAEGQRLTSQSHYARIVFRNGESEGAALGRLGTWLNTVPLPKGARFGFQEVVEEDAPNVATVIGLRTHVFVEEPVLRTVDIEDANVSVDRNSDPPSVYVSVRLTRDAGRRFGDATKAWKNRRIAIVVDGIVESAPVVLDTIYGGMVSITMGAAPMDEQLANARRLEGRLQQAARSNRESHRDIRPE